MFLFKKKEVKEKNELIKYGSFIKVDKQHQQFYYKKQLYQFNDIESYIITCGSSYKPETFEILKEQLVKESIKNPDKEYPQVKIVVLLKDGTRLYDFLGLMKKSKLNLYSFQNALQLYDILVKGV